MRYILFYMIFISNITVFHAMEYSAFDEDIPFICQDDEQIDVPSSIIAISKTCEKSLKLTKTYNKMYCPSIKADEIILLIPLCNMLIHNNVHELKNRLMVHSKSQLLTLSKIADYLDIPLLIQPLSQALARIMKQPEELAKFHEDEEYDNALLHPDIQQAIVDALLSDNPLKKKMIESRELLYYVSKRSSNSILSACWSSDCRYIALQSSSAIYVEDVIARKGLSSLEQETGHILSIQWFADSDNLAILDSNKTIYIWNVCSDSITVCSILKDCNGSIGSASWSADNNYIAMRLVDNTIVIADTNTGECVHECKEYNKDRINEIRWSPDGRYIAFSSCNAIYIRETKTWTPIQTLGRHKYMIHSFEWSNDGSYVASGGYDGKVSIWETKTWSCVRTLPHEVGINSMSWNHNADYLAVSLFDNSVCLSNVKIGKECYKLCYKHWTNEIHWSPDGTAIIIILPSYNVCLWQVKNIYACNSLNLEQVLLLELFNHKKSKKNNGEVVSGKKNNYLRAIFESLPFSLQQILIGSSLGLTGILKGMNIISPDTSMPHAK